MIHFFTIVLDGMPWVTRHHESFRHLRQKWDWTVVEGVAQNTACTAWCNKLEPRLSKDGTHSFLNQLTNRDTRVRHRFQPVWPGKVAMCNAALETMKTPGLLWQVDVDEVWTPEQIEAVAKLFDERPDANCAFFWCRYFVGPDLVVKNRGSWGNNPAYEWKRVWRFQPWMRFARHEPPIIHGMTEKPILHADTEKVGAVFDHYAYATESQVRFKQEYYSGQANPHGLEYHQLVEGWLRLQLQHKWPAKLQHYFPFVPPETMVGPVGS